ncbi:conserved hypothetical protein [Aspergillus terreus NIH2624]|uniref:Uncharacterized protein n=2 Tax=Aspergillus terreus TaxID=33178 RepID=Q0CHK7_ASPTN|nr:uncharacterized protein ATEG_06827 [Aspergillus terreus NIH2624]EAU33371.1 conserved hypothetical protein [Aspergillus terreus NIH2624]KAG2414184.1 hypothetical protein HFD88_003375 [Aspergillus terreus]GES64499.1 hypothetical protein ATETN484_0010057800 [Aspergillus terreus]GFF18625.1 putative CRISPR-associated protein [Aspergillus terreus]
MISSSFAPSLTRRDTGKSSIGHETATGAIPPPLTSGGGSFGPQSAAAIYQHIHDMATKRISTLDYLRRAHEGRIYWFNTVHFSRADINRIPYFESRKLARRAINYLLLGLSLPPILDVSSTPAEYLRALNALLIEFETFQQVHPPDGSSSSTLARARIPQMFKRAAHAGGKTRRASSATEIGLPMQSSDPSDLKAMAGNIASSTAAAVSFPHTEASELLPGEEYSYLLTPSLPFEPDYFETFITLCDVLIDCYTRLVALVSSPSLCTVALGEMFAKADTKLRKIMVAGVVREFEDASRNNAKNEVAGVSRVVLGGLMG